MKLYFFHVAPNPTKVRLYLAEKKAGGAAIEVEEVLVDYRKGEQNAPEHLARNPFGRTPVLELDDGSSLTESLAIVEYLEETNPTPAMLGGSPIERARVRELERIADLGVLLPAALVVHGTDSPLGMPANPGLAEHYRPRLRKSLEYIDARLADGRPFLAGDSVTIADCSLQAGLQFGRFGKLELDADLEHVARWNAAFRERASCRDVLLY